MIVRIWDVTLTVRDLERAVGFYRDILGLALKYKFGDYAGFDVGGVELGSRRGASWDRRGRANPW